MALANVRYVSKVKENTCEAPYGIIYTALSRLCTLDLLKFVSNSSGHRLHMADIRANPKVLEFEQRIRTRAQIDRTLFV